MAPEFSRPLRVSAIPPAGYQIDVTANAEERRALARRFELPSLAALSCTFALSRNVGVREAGAITRAAGHLLARLTQLCRVTLEEFPADVEERFVVLFVPSGHESASFDPEAPDEIPCTDGMIDLGEVAAEQLALALDPWPRKPEAAPEPS
ncbi:MAG: YceD family protein [Acetobacteraceae bacterium]